MVSSPPCVKQPPCVKKFQKFCLIFFLRKITSKSFSCRFMKNCKSNWNVLLAVTWVKYLCYFGAFLKLASYGLSFSKHRDIISKKFDHL